MLFFANDYCEGAHENVLTRICKENLVKRPGYGTDEVSESAKAKIRTLIKQKDAGVWFVSGGTQVNLVAADAILDSYEGILAVETGHVAVHEAGAIEKTGHKVLTLPHHEGKMDARDLGNYLKSFCEDENHDHMVRPGMVYLSQPTEFGTLYGLSELKAIRAVCDKYDVKLFVDGARLAYALGAKDNDVTLEKLASIAHAFTIGGTKCGALFGEALVFSGMKEPSQMLTRIKQHGALLAKGWLVGMQFDELLEGNLYTTLGTRADALADKLRAALMKKRYELYVPNTTNQVLVILEGRETKTLGKKVRYSFWEALDKNRTVVRFCISWATSEKDVDELIEIL